MFSCATHLKTCNCHQEEIMHILEQLCEQLLDKTLFENEDVDLFQYVVHPKVFAQCLVAKKLFMAMLVEVS
jgi:predicted metal-binding transcription factor (methanogenesis marker protein 9)